MKDNNEQLFCSFCGKPKELTKRLIAGPNGIFICDECIVICKEIIKEERVLLKKIVNIFNFSINIFKNYGNLPEEYVIIEDKRRIMLSENKPLPITLTSSFAIVGETREVVRSDEELLVLAKQAHESAVLSYLSSAEIVFIQTQGEFVDDGYIMKSEICMLTQIGITIPVPIA